ncbi:MAG TPA: cytochrome c oxidase assembly protein [Actinobacteria bacterium]|jgi:putative membrane protein|nr:cytochrome c oxidase assembly protein [Actinomycetota bacterium]HCP62088.1 cytochrome c oxidase assembly protein [Actinomycetota bacterium]
MIASVFGRWSVNPSVGPMVLGAMMYARGVRILWRQGGRGRGVSTREVAAFAGGMAVLVVALVSPVDAKADSLLSVHMVQHLLFVLVAPPLLVLGRPALPMMLALPRSWRRSARRLEHSTGGRGVTRVFTQPVFVFLLHVAVMWAWHVPAFYDAAVRNNVVHAAEHTTFLATAMLFWWVVLEPGRRRRLARGAALMCVFADAMQSSALGALLAFAGTPLYEPYIRLSGAVAALRDQQLAGLIMWVPAGVVYLVIASILFVRWLQGMEREMRMLEGREERVPVQVER